MDELTIKSVSYMTGLSEFTLRGWEKRYSAIKPKRNRSGRRVYQMSDVERLQLLRSLTESGQNIGQIAQLPTQKLKKLYQQIVQAAPLASANSSVSVQQHLQNLLKAVHELDLPALALGLRMAQMQFDTRTFLTQVISPFLDLLGAEVSQGTLDLYHEHATSALVRNVLTGLLYLTEQSVLLTDQPPIVFSTPENEWHEFGILICAIIALLNGSRVLYLGPNLPATSVAKACEMVESSVVVLGAAVPAAVVSAAELQKYFHTLAKHLSPKTRIWVGGGRGKEIKTAPNLRALPLTVLNNFDEFDRSVKRLSAPRV